MNSSRITPSGCEVDLVMGQRLQKPSPVTFAVIIFIIIINIITIPFTAALNALVMMAVKKKSRLRVHKSNILLAMLASTDFAVGILLQPVFTAVLVLFLLDEPSGYCIMRRLKAVGSVFSNSSLYHLALISGERYVAIKHSFAHSNLITEVRLMAASATAWLLPVLLVILFLINETVALIISNAVASISIAFIVFCHVTVYRETRRHEKQLAVQQVTQQAREKFEKDKKALKLTSIILGFLFLCSTPLIAFRIIALNYTSKINLESMYMFFSFACSALLWNSFFNPVIYSVKMRQFRVAFIELIYRTENIVEAEEIDMRLFRLKTATVRIEARQEHEGQNQQNVEQGM